MPKDAIEAPRDRKTEQFAAAYLGVEPSTLRRWRMYKTGPAFIRVGARAIRYEQASLDAFLDECRRNSGGVR